MFKHKNHVEIQKNDECDELETQRYFDNADLEHEADDNIICDILNDKENESFNKTFVNPSQEMTSENTFKCENCDFRAANKDDMMKHKTTSHNWCDICFSSFVTQERLNLHLKKKHNKIVKTD
jgi:hypothetical protein